MGAETTIQQRWGFLALISVGLFLVGADNSVLYTALPTLERDLGSTPLEGLWIINAYPLVLVGLLLGTGTLGDKIGHRLMFLLGVGIFGVSSVLAALSPSSWMLIIARALLGCGAATMMPASLALIRITFLDERERNTAIGVWGSVAAVGAATGPILGGFLLEHFWWGSVFLINVPVALAVLIATIAAAPANVADPSRHWDFISSFYAMLAMVGTVTAIKELAHTQRHWWLIAVAFLVALSGGWAFHRRQPTLQEPLLSFSIFRNRMFSGGALAAACAMVCMSGIELTTTQRFQLIGGLSPFEAGLLVSIVAMACVPASIIGGANLHRLGFRRLIIGGFLMVAAGLGLTLWSFWAEHPTSFYLGLAAVGMGAGMTMSVSSTAIIGSAPAHNSGMAASVEAVSYEFGTLLAVAILGSLQPFFYGVYAPQHLQDINPAIPESAAAYDGSYFTILGIVIGFAILSAGATAWCFRGNPKHAYVPEGVL